MLKHQRLSERDYSRQNWKNGKGETLQLAVDNRQPFRWRLSSAKLSGFTPFSQFPNYDRTLLLLEGGPVVLIIDQSKRRNLSRLVPLSFKGEQEVFCEAPGLSADFNLFVLRDSCKGKIYPAYCALKEELQFPISANEHFLYCVNGAVTITERNSASSFKLSASELLRIERVDEGEYLNLKAVGFAESSELLWIPIHYLN